MGCLLPDLAGFRLVIVHGPACGCRQRRPVLALRGAIGPLATLTALDHCGRLTPINQFRAHEEDAVEDQHGTGGAVVTGGDNAASAVRS